MIIILCNSFQEVRDGFDVFVSFLEKYEPFSIKNIFEHAYCVETDDDLRYVFMDYRFKNLALKFNDCVEFADLDSFLEGIDEFYFGNGR